uniref:Uncharacterized protein n=1 Tax=Malurus cyaneus samueli TaxID=2593467 RepID=A0A8C5X9N2_9PASS
MRNPGKEEEKHYYGHVQILSKENVAVNDDGQAGHAGQQPDGDAGDSGHKHGAADPRLHRVHDGQVAVDAEARQQEHAGVQVETYPRRRQLAQTVAKRPLVLHGRVGCPEGQLNDNNDQAVPEYAYDKDDAVNGWNHNVDVAVPS